MHKRTFTAFLFSLIFIGTTFSKYLLYEWRTEVFDAKGAAGTVNVEKAIYELLKKKPLHSNVTYFAFPWSYFIGFKEMGRLESLEPFLPKIKFQNGFTVCQSIHYRTILPYLKKLGITVLFTPHTVSSEVYEGITIVSIPHYPLMGCDPAPIKDIYCSFIGALGTHPIRTVMVETLLQKTDKYYLKPRGYWHYARDFLLPNCNPKQQQEEFAREYKDVLARSRFSLCPRGTGPSTIRFWESLQAGAIPVVLSDVMDYLVGFNWNSCVVKIQEKDIDLIDTILSNISLEQELEMRQACYDAYDAFCGNNFDFVVRNFFDGRLQDVSTFD